MSDENVTQEEIEALTAPEESAAVGVRPRDFRQPRRFSPETLDRFRVDISVALPSLAMSLRPLLRETFPFRLETVSEVHSQGIAGTVSDPVCSASFECEGGLGWVIWSNEAARSAVTTALGSDPSKKKDDEAPDEDANEIEFDLSEGGFEPRVELSEIEASVACELLSLAVNRIGEELDFRANQFDLIQSAEALELSVEGQRAEDPARLLVNLVFEGPGGAESRIDVYIPGVRPPKGELPVREGEDALAVPDHLVDVQLELAAELGSAEIPLADLLKIEIGDVIPLSTRVDTPMHVAIEEYGCATAKLGRKDGQLAILLEELNLSESED